MSFGSRSSSTAQARTPGLVRAGLPPSRAFEPTRGVMNSAAETRGGASAGDGSAPSPAGHDLARIGVYGDAARESGRDADSLAIASSGDPTATITYTPEAADKSTKIVFIQVVQVSLDGTPVKPGTASTKYAHLDADTTSDFYSVDYTSGEADPYYNGDDAGKDGGTQGNATSTPKVNADMTDTPNYKDTSFPAGKSTFKAQFRTIAFSAAGADKGKFYAYAKWSYNKQKGKAATLAHEGTSTNTALPKCKAAIDLWCSNHSFTLPK